MVIISHPTGNMFAREVIRTLGGKGLLQEYWTSIGLSNETRWVRFLPPKLLNECLRRSYDIPFRQLRTQSLREIVRLACIKFGRANLIRGEDKWASIDQVYRSLDRRVARRLAKLPSVTSVYAYEDAALESFRDAKARSILALYDLPIGYWRAARALLSEEAERLPQWASTLTGNQDSERKLARKDEELSLSDAIFVASTFTAETLRLAPTAKGKPVHIVPYGAPPPISRALLDEHLARLSRPGVLRVLFVGGLSQRKGIAEVFAACDSLRSAVTLTVIGRHAADCPALTTALGSCRYIPSLPHSEILREMREHDVLVFPSLFEGFGLVILEAMAQGVPVITTPHTGGRDVITPGKDGVIVPIRDTQAIVRALEDLHKDRVRLVAMSEAAWKKSADYTWSAYGGRIVTTIQDLITNRQPTISGRHLHG